MKKRKTYADIGADISVGADAGVAVGMDAGDSVSAASTGPPVRRLSLDIETFSSVDLSKSGVYRYAEAPDFCVLLIGYSFDGGPVSVVDLKRRDGLFRFTGAEGRPIVMMGLYSFPEGLVFRVVK